jgi:glycerol-3-phosphate dehydrogenase subunit B
MKHSDVIVIGSGVAGMTAALASAQQGKSVTLLTYGASSLSLNSGLIDILAFDDEHKAVKSPLEGIKSLPACHPYSKIGADYVEKAVEFFCAFAKKYHLPYHGSLNSQMMVPTAVGTLKPTCLAPHSLSGSESFVGKKKVVVVGVKGLKDFYADIMIQNLKKAMGEELSYESVRSEERSCRERVYVLV